MANRERVRRASLRAYELGRLRVAARATWVLVPIVLLCALETGAGETCACIGVLLLGASIFLRWRDKRGVDSVRDGIRAGALPLAAGLVVARFTDGCGGEPMSVCTAVCMVGGVPAGAWLGSRLARRDVPWSSWLAAGSIAGLVASLGCASLGLAAVAGAIAGLSLGAASSKLVLPA